MMSFSRAHCNDLDGMRALATAINLEPTAAPTGSRERVAKNQAIAMAALYPRRLNSVIRLTPE
jgi:hypothetical protein